MARGSPVIFARAALDDLEEIVRYWAGRGEQERGEQYARDLPKAAIDLLSNKVKAESGRYLKGSAFPHTQELAVFDRSYRILYFRRLEQEDVVVLRFWPSHREEPFPLFGRNLP